jgi:putative inorganic carbon (HCO3(-)) transporter
MEFWSSGIHAIHDFPLTGMGMNGFRKLMPTRYPTSLTGTRDMAHAHNSFLQAALDLGIPGLIAYAAIWMVTAVLLITVYRRSGVPVYRILAGGLGAGLIAQFIFGIFDAIPLGSKVGVLFWLTLALAGGLHRVGMAKGGGG